MDNTTPIISDATSAIDTNIQKPQEQSNRLLFSQRFLKIMPPHMRVNRSWFFMNFLFIVILEWIASRFLPWALGVLFSLFIFYLIAIQIVKRSHDFNNSGKFILWGMILLSLMLIIWPSLYFSMISDNIFASLWVFMKYGTYILIAQIIPYIILALIPGDPEDNQYWKSYGL